MNNHVWLYSAGTLVSAAAVMKGKILKFGGTDIMYVSSGGSTLETAVSKGGTLYICSGGSGIKTEICSSGKVEISCGAIANSTNVNQGGLFTVSSGGTAVEIRENGGTVTVLSGAEVSFASNTISGLVLSGDATIHSNTSADAVTVNSYAHMTVYKGGLGSMTVSSGGKACNTLIDAGQVEVYAGGSMHKVTVSSGGRLHVCSSGRLSGTLTFDEDTSISVDAGAEIDFTVTEQGPDGAVLINDWSKISGRNEAVYTVTVGSGSVSSQCIYALAANAGDFSCAVTVQQESGAVAGTVTIGNPLECNTCTYSLKLTDGLLKLVVDPVDQVKFYHNNVLLSSGKSMSDKELGSSASGNYMTVDNGGEIYNIGVNRYGKLLVKSGGKAQRIIENGGYIQVDDGASVLFAENIFANHVLDCESATVHSNTTAAGTVLEYNGQLEVYSGGLASNTTLNRGGVLYVSSGGIADTVTVNQDGTFCARSGCECRNVIENGGWVTAEEGALVQFASHTFSNLRLNQQTATVHSNTVAENTVIENFSFLRVSSGGKATSSLVSSGGNINLLNGGLIEDTRIYANGGVSVKSGGIVHNTNVFSGGLILLSGGCVHSGFIHIDHGGVFQPLSGSCIDLTVADLLPDQEPVINNWSLLGTAPGIRYTITVKADQEEGLYLLADGANEFSYMPAVKLTTGEVLGSVFFGIPLETQGNTYSLVRKESCVCLEITKKEPPVVHEYTGELILTITDKTHAYAGVQGGWKIKADQTVEWQNLSTLQDDFVYLGNGYTAAGKEMPDIFIYSESSKYIGAYITDNTGSVQGFESVFTGEKPLMQVGLGDFNADGVTDLMLRTADGFAGYYANGTFREIQGLGTEWTVASLGDVDGNGTSDVIIAHDAGYTGAYLVGTDGTITWTDLGNLDADSSIIGSGDFNGDGVDDILIKTGSDYYGAWLCSAGKISGFMGIGNFDARVQQIADYNGDGIDDIAFRTPDGVVGAALIFGENVTTWSQYGALGDEWSAVCAGIL